MRWRLHGASLRGPLCRPRLRTRLHLALGRSCWERRRRPAAPASGLAVEGERQEAEAACPGQSTALRGGAGKGGVLTLVNDQFQASI